MTCQPNSVFTGPRISPGCMLQTASPNGPTKSRALGVAEVSARLLRARVVRQLAREGREILAGRRALVGAPGLCFGGLVVATGRDEDVARVPAAGLRVAGLVLLVVLAQRLPRSRTPCAAKCVDIELDEVDGRLLFASCTATCLPRSTPGSPRRRAATADSKSSAGTVTQPSVRGLVPERNLALDFGRQHERRAVRCRDRAGARARTRAAPLRSARASCRWNAMRRGTRPARTCRRPGTPAPRGWLPAHPRRSPRNRASACAGG